MCEHYYAYADALCVPFASLLRSACGAGGERIDRPGAAAALDVAAWLALPALVRSDQLHAFVTAATRRALTRSTLRAVEAQLSRCDALVWELRVAQVRWPGCEPVHTSATPLRSTRHRQWRGVARAVA